VLAMAYQATRTRCPALVLWLEDLSWVGHVWGSGSVVGFAVDMAAGLAVDMAVDMAVGLAVA